MSGYTISREPYNLSFGTDYLSERRILPKSGTTQVRALIIR